MHDYFVVHVLLLTHAEEVPVVLQVLNFICNFAFIFWPLIRILTQDISDFKFPAPRIMRF